MSLLMVLLLRMIIGQDYAEKAMNFVISL